MYAPALAMNQVAGLDINVAIIVVGCVCIFYTSIGGMKAVIWTDVYQSIWMFSGFAILVIVASFDFEGFGNVLKAVQRGHRGTPQFEIDPRYRKSYILDLNGSHVPTRNSRSKLDRPTLFSKQMRLFLYLFKGIHFGQYL